MTSLAFTPDQKWDTCLSRVCVWAVVPWEVGGVSVFMTVLGSSRWRLSGWVGRGGEPEADRAAQGQGSGSGVLRGESWRRK